MSEESDIEMKSALPKKSKQAPVSPTADMLKEPKRITTKEMINEALVELRSRKGTSLFAIKKYIELKYNVDVEKIKHIIKKYLVSSVEDGTIIQTKGIGASGSFKLVASKEKKEKKKQKGEKKTKKKNPEKKETDKKEKTEKSKLKKPESNTKGEKLKKVEPETKIDKKDVKKKTIKPKKKIEKGAQTPAKKRAAMMKRKSIGSIIKPPKMKPSAKRAAI